MDINTYDLILNTESKLTHLQLKESFTYPCDRFTNPRAIFELMRRKFNLHTRADEFVYLAAFNNAMRLLGLFEISHGTVNASLIDPRGVFLRALQIGASSIMLIHNHTSGRAIPSRDDMNTCKRIKKAGELLGIQLSDFLIIGCDEYLSFRDEHNKKAYRGNHPR
ncbi:MAG: DNA repair protein RadC [Lachnospiraceae bacterium]|nr:DNA repair protein RadC [Lachnospiraceae bacterium]